MSNFPNNFDDDTTLPFVNDNITEIGGEAINALRDAVFAIEQNIGLGAQGTTPSIADRFGISFFPDGTLKPSAITSLGLVTLPITQDQIAVNAQIPESKLRLDHRTQDLFNYIRDLSGDVNLALGWISSTGIKLEPHLIGAIYRHNMDQVDVSNNEADFLFSNKRILRDNSQSYSLVADMNAELLAHQWADGSVFGSPYTITTNNGSVFSSNYAHLASAVFINTTRFNNIPQAKDDLQLFAEYMDDQSIFLLGTRIQNLYTSGISRISRSSNLTTDGYGQFIVPVTPAVAFLKNIGNSSSPYDNIDTGDDIIEFKPSAADKTNNVFDTKFALVKVGDIVRINYGTIEVPFVIKEKKYDGTTGAKKYIVRIAGKNQFYAPNAVARIDRPLFNSNKYAELSLSPVNNQFNETPSLVVNNPRGAQALGLGFNPKQLNEKHYLLYIALYPTGFAQDGYTILPAIDVTGNQGRTPGQYTLESVVQATNNAFRALGYNYRFTAFSYQGEFGVCLADSYSNSAFSILSVALKSDGTIDSLATQIALPNNVVDLQPIDGNNVAPDPLGLGPSGSGVASPPFYTVYGSAAASQNPTKLFIPLRRNSFYVNGTEKERLAREDSQALDGYGDGYWVATIQDVQTPSGRVQTTYRVPLDLSTTGLKAGKTIVVQSLGAGGLVDFGRFIIYSVVFGCSPDVFTDITVYDSVHATGFSPTATLQPFNQVALYFGADSVSFNAESATDYSAFGNFKRHFEVYVDQDGKTFTHERGRISTNDTGVPSVNGTILRGSSQLKQLDIVKISPKLRGYQFGSVNKITLKVFSYSSTTGVYDGYLASYDGTYLTHIGPRTTGRKGQTARFFDETNTDYIDIIFDVGTTITTFSNEIIDFQLFPSLASDDEIMMLGTCQVNDSTHTVSKIVDGRQFGNISEKDLSTSVFDYLSVPEKYLHSNGVVRGFDIFQKFNGNVGTIDLSGGVVLVNGKLYNINNDTVNIPAIRETFSSFSYDVNWALCVNDIGEYDLIPLLNAFGSTPSTTGRLFTALDVVSNTTYTLPALTFSDLINTRPDLTILYIVTSSVAGTTSPVVTITTKDVRKFVYKKDWGERPTLVLDTANGEFRSFEALEQWFNLNSGYTSNITVKGAFSSVPTTLQYNFPVTFMSDGVTAFTLPSAFTVGSAITFRNITFTYSAGAGFGTTTFDTCTVTGSGTTATLFSICTGSNSSFSFSGASSVTFSSSTFNNCIFTFSAANIVTFTSCTFNNCTFNFNGAGTTISTNSTTVFNKNIFNINASLTTANFSGVVSGNTFNWNNPTIGLTMQNNFTVVENIFNTIGSFTSSFINTVTGTNGTISENYFYRNNNTITSYIAAPVTWSSGVVSVVNNFFDKTTVDGTNQNLVSNLPLVWIYTNNLNAPFTLHAKRTSAGGTYTVALEDQVLEFKLTSALVVVLPSIALSPPGRVITIKDANGLCDSFPITIRAGNTVTDAIENAYGDFIYKNPYGSVTLVATIDPNGGGAGSGLTPKYMWCIV